MRPGPGIAFCIMVHRFSRTKKCSTMKLEAVKVTKKMPRSVIFGHQKDCARRPNVERIVAAGTSSSTPYCRCVLELLDVRKKSDGNLVFF